MTGAGRIAAPLITSAPNSVLKVADTLVFPSISLLHLGVLPVLAGFEGVILKDAAAHHSIHEACLKFEESQRLDPSGGTILNLASCHEREGRLARAWSEFSDAATMAIRDGKHEREVLDSRLRATRR